ncbi:MAG: hypothetical protein GEU71_02905 [Actinobacteria bacterium]|nr:hypothetical protein [Actinomycetota bacterium]
MDQIDRQITVGASDIQLPDPLDLLASYVDLVREDLAKGEIERVLNYLRTICVIGAQVEQQLRLGIGIGQNTSNVKPAVAAQTRNRSDSSATGLGRPRSPESAELSRAILEVLGDHSGPVTLKELMEALVERGVQLPGQGKAANLIAHMNRMSEIERVKRGLYSLTRASVS